MRRKGYLWTSGVNLDIAIQFADPDFLLECKILAIWRRFPLFFSAFYYRAMLDAFYILNVRLYTECPPYFYFRFVWPSDLESVPHTSPHTSIIPTKFEVDMTIHCRITALLSADTSRDFVTLTFDLLTFNSCHTWRVTRSTLPPSMKTLRLSILELWVDIFGMLDHDLPIHYATSLALRWN